MAERKQRLPRSVQPSCRHPATALTMRYLLDTDICIYVINQRPPAVRQAFKAHEVHGLGISAVTAGELFYGVARTGSEKNLRGLRPMRRR